jgi:WG containing repeat
MVGARHRNNTLPFPEMIVHANMNAAPSDARSCALLYGSIWVSAKRVFGLVVLSFIGIAGCTSQSIVEDGGDPRYRRIHINGAWGYRTVEGDTIIPPGRYTFLNPMDDQRMILAYHGALQGYIDIHEHVLIPFEYEDLGVFCNDRAPAKKNGKFGMIDRSGNQMVAFKYDEVR